MLLQQLKHRLRMEYAALCTYLTTASMTAGDLLNKAYEVVWKQEIVNLFEVMPEVDCRYSDCFLQALFGKSCKIFLENVASPNWRKLQSLNWQLSCQLYSHCRPNIVVTA